MSGHNRGAQDLTLGSHADPREPLRIAFNNDAINAFHGEFMGFCGNSPTLGLGFVKPHARHFWNGISGPGNLEMAKTIASEEKCVLDHDARHRVGGMGELEASRNISGGVNTTVGCTQMIVNVYAFSFIEGNTGGL